jgi:hypothetical protein
MALLEKMNLANERANHPLDRMTRSAAALSLHIERPWRAPRHRSAGRSGYVERCATCRFDHARVSGAAERRAHNAFGTQSVLVRSSRSSGGSWPIVNSIPEPVAPPNPAEPPQFHSERRRRRVGEPGRSAITFDQLRNLSLPIFYPPSFTAMPMHWDCAG